YALISTPDPLTLCPLFALELPHIHRSRYTRFLAHGPSLAVAQAQLGHDPQRGDVLGECLRLDQAQAQLGKAELQYRSGRFGRVALSPVRFRQHVTDVADAVGNIECTKTASPEKGLIGASDQAPFIIAALRITDHRPRHKTARGFEVLMAWPGDQAADVRVAGVREHGRRMF